MIFICTLKPPNMNSPFTASEGKLSGDTHLSSAPNKAKTMFSAGPLPIFLTLHPHPLLKQKTRTGWRPIILGFLADKNEMVIAIIETTIAIPESSIFISIFNY